MHSQTTFPIIVAAECGHVTKISNTVWKEEIDTPSSFGQKGVLMLSKQFFLTTRLLSLRRSNADSRGKALGEATPKTGRA